jgi:hypothetical protein
MPVRLTVCADAAVAANTAAAAMTHDVILMKITPQDYADPTIWASGGILRLFGSCAFGSITNDGKPVPFSATRDGTFPAIPLPEFRFSIARECQPIPGVNPKTNRGLRQGS